MSITITYSATTMSAIESMTALVAQTEQARLDGKVYAGNGELFERAKAAARDVNKNITKDASRYFADLASKDMTAFIKAYWTDWEVIGFSVVQDKAEEGGKVHTADKPIRILYSAVDSISQTPIASNGAWRKYLQIYGDNVAQFLGTNDKGETALSVKNPLPQELVKLRDEKGGNWVKCSHSALVQQLNDLVDMVFPANMKPAFRMVSMDQKAMVTAIENWKDTTKNTASSFQQHKAQTVEKILFQQIFTRMNNLAISFDTGLREKEKQQGQPKNSEAKGGDVAAPQAPATEAPTAKTATKSTKKSKSTSKSTAKTAA